MHRMGVNMSLRIPKINPPRRKIYCKAQTSFCPKVKEGKGICCMWCEEKEKCGLLCDSILNGFWRDCPARTSRKKWITEKLYKTIFEKEKDSSIILREISKRKVWKD